MFKELGKLLKKGAMSVEYIVIGVCVIGMAALATAFVSNKMDIAMGQENNTGDNAGNGGNSNSGGTNARLTEAECIANKTFFETYGLYPGKYDVDTNDSMYREYKSEINVNGECTFEIYQPSYGSDMSSSKPKLKKNYLGML